jgi:two-component sensor histidine kinase
MDQREMQGLVIEELEPYRRRDGTRIRIEDPKQLIEPNTAQTMAVVCHELAPNAAKYGALSVKGGRVAVVWNSTVDGRLALGWTETGGPAVVVRTRQGFGTRGIDGMVEQVKCEARVLEGLACKGTIPVKE